MKPQRILGVMQVWDFARRLEKWNVSVRPYVRGFLGFRLFLEFSWENHYRGWIERVKERRRTYTHVEAEIRGFELI